MDCGTSSQSHYIYARARNLLLLGSQADAYSISVIGQSIGFITIVKSHHLYCVFISSMGGTISGYFFTGYADGSPMHYSVILFQLIIMTVSSVINHLDIEIYPKNCYNTFGKWIIGATHHSRHHKQFKYNYGLYFTFWDRLKKTESSRHSQTLCAE